MGITTTVATLPESMKTTDGSAGEVTARIEIVHGASRVAVQIERNILGEGEVVVAREMNRLVGGETGAGNTTGRKGKYERFVHEFILKRSKAQT